MTGLLFAFAFLLVNLAATPQIELRGDQTSISFGFHLEEDDPVTIRMKEDAAAENKQLPRKIDEITTLERTSVNGRTWTFHYSVDLDESRRADAIGYASEAAPRHACGDDFLRQQMQQYRVTYRFLYIIGANTEAHIVSVDQSTCKKLERLQPNP